MSENRNTQESPLAVLDQGASSLFEDSDQESFSTVVAGGWPRLRVRIVDGCSVVDILSAPALFDWRVIRNISDQLLRLIERGHTRLFLNLSEIRYMSSDFLAALVSLERRIVREHGRLGLFGLDPPMSDMVRICRLELLFDIYTTEREALDFRPAARDEPRLE